MPTFKSKFRLRNISSGLYLALGRRKNGKNKDGKSDNEEREMKLTLEYEREGGEFKSLFEFTSAKRDAVPQEAIQYQNSLLIMQHDYSNVGRPMTIFVEKMQTHPKENNKNGKAVSKSNNSTSSNISTNSLNCTTTQQKYSSEKLHFELAIVDKDTRILCDRVGSLVPFLLGYLVFLSDWGIEQNSIG